MLTMNKIKTFFHQWRCNHWQADLIKWHWTHGPYGNDPAFIEAEYHCKGCGKTVYLYQRGREAQEWAHVMSGYKEEGES